MYGETEKELLQNAKKHGMEVHGYTEQSWNEEIAKNGEHFHKLIKRMASQLNPFSFFIFDLLFHLIL